MKENNDVTMNSCPHWSIDGISCCSCGACIPEGTKVNQAILGDYFVNGTILLPLKQENGMYTLKLQDSLTNRYVPLKIILDGADLVLNYEDIKDLFYKKKEQKISKLIDFMRENNFKEKEISGVISNLR